MSTTPPTMPIALQAQGLRVQAGATTLLDGVDVTFAQGRWSAIVGPNGAGKSTLLSALAGLRAGRRVQGSVQLLGQDATHWRPKARARAQSWMGQNEAVALDLLAYDVVMLGRLPHQGWLAAPSAQDHRIAAQCLQQTHAAHLRQRPLRNLSGGERQRVLLARALAVQAQVLLMDEPLANLDPPHQSEWMEIVQGLVAQGHTVVSVLHELGIALQSDFMVVMQAGRVRHAGPTADVRTHAALEAVFDHKIRVRQVDGMWVALPVVAASAAR